MTVKPTVLITGASTGIGAVYADRFAKRGHDLVLVARDRARMEALADRLRRETGVAVDVLQADLTEPRQLAQIEARLRDDTRIGVLVNNAGASAAGGFVDQSPDDVANLISLNVTALTRLASAVAPRFVAAGEGTIINIGSVVGLVPEFGIAVYGATKAFVLFLSQGLAPRARPQGRLRPGGAAGLDPHRDLGAIGQGRERAAGRHGGGRAGGRGPRRASTAARP